MAKKIPRASTLNCNKRPGAMEMMVYSMTFPARMDGTIEAIMENLITAARIVHDSLRFLARLPVTKISNAAARETEIANNGFMEYITAFSTQKLPGTVN